MKKMYRVSVSVSDIMVSTILKTKYRYRYRYRPSWYRPISRKNQQKHPAFKDKSGDIKKVVIVRRRLMCNFICTTTFRKFWCIL